MKDKDTLIIPRSQVALFDRANRQQRKLNKQMGNPAFGIRVRKKGKEGRIYRTRYGMKTAKGVVGAIGWLQLRRQRMKVWFSPGENGYPNWDVVERAWKRVKKQLTSVKRKKTYARKSK